jgi:hypothetical protein
MGSRWDPDEARMGTGKSPGRIWTASGPQPATSRTQASMIEGSQYFYLFLYESLTRKEL